MIVEVSHSYVSYFEITLKKKKQTAIPLIENTYW